MNIGLLCHPSCGGSMRIAVELSKALAGYGHNVHVFSNGRPFGGDFKNNDVVFHSIGRKRQKGLHPAELYTDWTSDEVKAFSTDLIHSIRLHRLDIIHFHYAIPFAYLAMELKRSMGQSSPLLIGTLHGTDVTQCRRDLKKKTRLVHALRFVDGLTTVSDSHAKLSYDILGLAEPPEVIPNFVDLSQFRPVSRRNNKPSKPIIAHISNFRPIKNTPGVARIFKEIRASVDAQLWLIGDGPQMGVVEAILDNGSRRDVKYWGITQDVGPLLNRTDLLLINSHYESFNLAALEAMACGVPVLATKVGGIPEVVRHGETGFLFQKGDIWKAVDFTKRLFATPVFHGAMRKAALKQAEKFEITRILPLYEKFYIKTMKNNHDRPN
ncbi:N-acetyl-alpha-D-glucosaminyl L-malate synthase BshA [Desulfococcaceae bacterium HSG7]|nr:N-acetyl-alpha-D-glucosaminyl L-malate synthase BshA [Desulfococcaceae bacterium HSG7]